MHKLIALQKSMLMPDCGVVIYGAGLNGKFVYDWLKKYNIRCRAFIDRRELSCIDGVPVYQLVNVPDDLLDLPIVVALVGDVFNAVKDIRARGFVNLFSMADFFIFMETVINATLPNYYFLGKNDELLQKFHELSAVRDLFCDEKSREIFCNFINYRTTGEFEFLMMPDSGCEYYPDSRPFEFTEPISYIDCGAFTGDSIETLARNIDFHSIVAFEPDPANFEKLKKNITFQRFGCPVITLQYGVGARQMTCEFVITGSMYSMGVQYASMNQRGNVQMVQVNSIDNLFSEFGKVDFIKFDVEGFELDALKGAVNTIRNYRPVIAVSVYHKPCDIWEIPEYLHNIYPEADLYLRIGNDSFHDTICYAVPQKYKKER